LDVGLFFKSVGDTQDGTVAFWGQPKKTSRKNDSDKAFLKEIIELAGIYRSTHPSIHPRESNIEKKREPIRRHKMPNLFVAVLAVRCGRHRKTVIYYTEPNV